MWVPTAELQNSTALFPLFVLGASLMGSAHCTLMCGGIAALAGNSRNQAIAYQAGRALSYILLGAISGWVGSGIESSLIELWGTQMIPYFAALMSLLLLHQAYLLFAGRSLDQKKKKGLNPLLKHLGQLSSLDQSPRLKSAALGFFTVLLPCGWLYSFVLLAAASGSAFLGATLMAAFWLGAVPALSLGPILFKLGMKQKPNSRKTIAVLLFTAALINLGSKVWKTPNSHQQSKLEESSVPATSKNQLICH